MKRLMRNTSVVLVFTAALTAMADSTVNAQTPAAKSKRDTRKAEGLAARVPSDLKVVKNVVFKQADETTLDLMLFLPLEKKFDKSPLVVYIHGGGWGNGDKYRVVRRDVISVIRELNRRGVTCASIEDRLANGGKSTTIESVADCLDALSFLAKNAAEYGLDPTRIATFGSSAGGHLSLVTALSSAKDFPCDPAFDEHRVRVRCAVAYYPSASFVHPELQKGSNFENPRRLIPILGGPLEEKRDIAIKLSPVELLAKDGPPLLLVHGDKDAAVSHQHSLFLCERAKEKGAPAECLIVHGAGHGLHGKEIQPAEEEISRRTVEFFMAHLTP